MVFESELGQEFHGLVTSPDGPGRLLQIKYFTRTIGGGGSYFDDDSTLVQSGTDLWASGIVMPLKGLPGTREGVLVEQGLLSQSDVALFINGSIDLSGMWKVGIGSPATQYWRLVPNGIEKWPPTTDVVYQKAFLRVLQTGSLQGE